MDNKILFLSHELVAHHHDTLYHGFMELFGGEYVFDYPCQSKNHSTHLNRGAYEWWTYNNNNHLLSLTLEQWAQLINNNEIKYIVGNSRAIDNFITLITMLNKDIFKSICVIFFEEEGDPGFEVHRRCLEKLKPIYDKIDIHYKVDCIRNRVGSYEKIKPAYIGGPMNKFLLEIDGGIKPFEERQYDVCYIVGSSHPNRKIYYDLLKNNLNIGNNIIEYGVHKFGLHEYFNTINNSKIFISVRGNEWSNTRNIEGPLLGSALFTEKLLIEMPFDYEDEKSAIFFDVNNLIPKLYKYINEQGKLKELASASHNWAMKYHTTKERAIQLVNLAEQIKGW